MEKSIFITDLEREKCRRVADAFAELYEQIDMVVVDARKYGFVKLQYYGDAHNFEIMSTFKNSKKLFDDLWQDWFEEQVLAQVEGTPLEELEYEEIFAQLTKEKQDEIMSRKSYFKEKAEFE